MSPALTVVNGYVNNAAGGATPNGVVLDGSSGCYVTTPDHADWGLAGVVRWVARVKATDWTKGSEQAVFSRYGAAGQKSWWWIVRDVDGMNFVGFADGTTGVLDNDSSAFGLTDNVAYWIGYEYNTATGAYAFYKCADQASVPTIWASWTSVSSGTIAASTLFDGTSPVYLGGMSGDIFRLTGTIYRAQIYDDGVLVANPDFSATGSPLAVPGAGTYTDSLGKVWTMNGTAAIV